VLLARGTANCGCFGSRVHVPPAAMLALDTALLLGILLVRPWSSLIDRRPGIPWLLTALALALGLPWLADREATGATPVGTTLRPYVALELEAWVGKDVWDTPLGRPPLSEHLDATSLPPDGLWVFWRWTCDHCREHLAELARSEQGARLITLLRLREPIDSPENRVVAELPAGDFVVNPELPPDFDYVITTPGELLLEGGRIVRAVEGATAERKVSTSP
jgi:hypothetical protein